MIEFKTKVDMGNRVICDFYHINGKKNMIVARILVIVHSNILWFLG
jgi:hypothetical protein